MTPDQPAESNAITANDRPLVNIQGISKDLALRGSLPFEAGGQQVSPAPEPIVIPVIQEPIYSHESKVSGKPQNRFTMYWRKIGGGSLTLSLIIHAGILLGAYFVVQTITQEQKVDFLAGRGSQKGDASSQLSQQVQAKKRNALSKSVPMRKIVSSSLDAAIALPDVPMDTIDLPEMRSLMGGASGSAGFGTAGAGGGFGAGMGIGGMKGVTFKPIFMFGNEIKNARKIAVVMDVSRSMTKYLPVVIKELDKVAKGSVVVLYFGCGLKTPPKNIDDKVENAKNA